ncbi:hypothetical protein BO82DRAFT_391537 [Aspergillus uvarum CBS 121591]|uniref:Cyanovirin-N domain-containing protein n=1 Tax=Aspergillus uvarum CBS 121591 TaxID=1448315 RepID=A0A319CC42_9EURO|nr:hypothetical protein BO82DRAFT_391537 [Aspergillus uvarum CBS 121591]PYH82744.1 hypothetical protein BO82DRAFT_391537 [Aspergillus uvarum CBS 121591]
MSYDEPWWQYADNITVRNGATLCADLQDDDGNYQQAEVNLDNYLGVYYGHIQWGATRFTNYVKGLEFHDGNGGEPYFTVTVPREFWPDGKPDHVPGRWDETKFSLDAVHIKNDNGSFRIDVGDGPHDARDLRSVTFSFEVNANKLSTFQITDSDGDMLECRGTIYRGTPGHLEQGFWHTFSSSNATINWNGENAMNTSLESGFGTVNTTEGSFDLKFRSGNAEDIVIRGTLDSTVEKWGFARGFDDSVYNIVAEVNWEDLPGERSRERAMQRGRWTVYQEAEYRERKGLPELEEWEIKEYEDKAREKQRNKRRHRSDYD